MRYFVTPMVWFSVGVLLTCVQSSAMAQFNTRDIRGREEYKPTFDEKMKVHKVVKAAGKELILKCIFTAIPKARVTWRLNDRELKRRINGKAFSTQTKREIAKLILPDLTTQDQGNYTCVIKNKHGSVAWEYVVDVQEHIPKGPAVIAAPIGNVTVYEGQTATFSCHIVSYAAVYVQWFKHKFIDGVHVSPNGTYYGQVIQSTFDMIANDKDDVTVLNLVNVSREDEGKYSCIVRNRFSVQQKSGWLTVMDPVNITGIPTIVIAQPSKSYMETVVPMVAGFSAVLLVVVIISACCFYRCCLYKKKMERQQRFRQGVIMHSSELYTHSNERGEYLIPVDRKWEFPRDRLQLHGVIGEGAFGQVLKGVARGVVGKPNDETIVAVKMLKDMATEQDLKALIKEVQMNKTIGYHKNVISLLGCCTQDGPLMLIFEFAQHGSLRDFLKRNRPHESGYEVPMDRIQKHNLSQKDLVSYGYQVAIGMEYLAGKHVIHRDLAARNVLVSDKMQMKIGDFGLTRDADSDYYFKRTKGPVPVKWMSPEALYEGKYSSKSDVWSFGILLWEIYSFGATPYPTTTEDDLIQLLKHGHRMEKPFYCQDMSIYEIMLKCWKYQPKQRPSFSDLVKILEQKVAQTNNHGYLKLESRSSESGPDSDTHVSHGPSDSQYSSLPPGGSILSEDVFLNEDHHECPIYQDAITIEKGEELLPKSETLESIVCDINANLTIHENEEIGKTHHSASCTVQLQDEVIENDPSSDDCSENSVFLHDPIQGQTTLHYMDDLNPTEPREEGRESTDSGLPEEIPLMGRPNTCYESNV